MYATLIMKISPPMSTTSDNIKEGSSQPVSVWSQSTSSTDIEVTTATTTQSYFYNDYFDLRLGQCGEGQPALKMKIILLTVAAFCATA